MNFMPRSSGNTVHWKTFIKTATAGDWACFLLGGAPPFERIWHNRANTAHKSVQWTQMCVKKYPEVAGVKSPFIASQQFSIIYSRVTLKLLTPPPSRTNENERFIHQLEIQLVFTGGGEGGRGKWDSSSDRLEQDQKKERDSTVERNLNVTLTPSSTSLRVKTAIPCVLSQFWEQGRIAFG